MMKYSIGDIVQIRTDLNIGQIYRNENSLHGEGFTYSMKSNAGKDARIVAIRQSRYVLNIDGGTFNYTDGMLQYPIDKLKEEEYTFNSEIEKLIMHMETIHLKWLIDEAIDSGDRNSFMELTSEYNDKKARLNKILQNSEKLYNMR